MVLEVPVEALFVSRSRRRLGPSLRSCGVVRVDVFQRPASSLALRHICKLGQRILRLSLHRGIFHGPTTVLLIILFLNSRFRFPVQLVSIATIAYLCVCAYSTVLKIRVLNLYYLAPHHQTDEYSLIFSGMLLCRLTPPMCLNFLGLIHMDSHIIKARLMETYYTQVSRLTCHAS